MFRPKSLSKSTQSGTKVPARAIYGEKTSFDATKKEAGENGYTANYISFFIINVILTIMKRENQEGKLPYVSPSIETTGFAVESGIAISAFEGDPNQTAIDFTVIDSWNAE